MTINFDQFKTVELVVGEILAATRVPETDKLLQLRVDFGAAERQIVSGIAPYFPEPQILLGKKCVFVANLETRTIRGLTSAGMILAAKSDTAFSLLEVNAAIPAGTVVG